MSPRPGGEAAKFGARFEGRWTTSYLLDVLMGRADAVTVEAVDPDSDSVEFIVLASGREEGHQVKRQWKDRMNWSIQLLDEQGILGDAASHVARGRDFHFVSTLSAHPLAELAELARRANDFASFSALISGTKTLRNGFDVLSKLWSTPQQAYETLRHVEDWKPDERQLQKANVSLGQWLFEGEPEPAIAVLAEIANDTLGVALTSDRLWRELEARKVARNPLYDDTTLASLVDERTRRLLRTTQAGLLQPPIPREETAATAEALASGRRLEV